jgi:AraC-like DNA-binding protein
MIDAIRGEGKTDGLAEELCAALSSCARDLGENQAILRFPGRGKALVPCPEGHFHLRPELFYQLSGTTEFRFAGETLILPPGGIALVPARYYHAERAEGGSDGPFRNAVIFADQEALSCHLAVETGGGRPGILYAERCRGPSSLRIAGYLEDAVGYRHGEGIEADLKLADPGIAGPAQAIRDPADPRDPANPRDPAGALVLAAVLASGLSLASPDRADGTAEPRLVGRARRAIQDHIGDPGLSVASLAENLACSADYLSHLFREASGERLVDYIHERRMARAADLLSLTELSCKEIAWASGFSNQSYFIRLFRGRFGLSPIEYRVSNLQSALVPVKGGAGD